MAKIAVVGPRPNNSNILTVKDGVVWKEMKRVLYEDLTNPEWQSHTFLIPIYSKFDLEVLAICEQKKYAVEFYVPSESWGKEKLPQHRTSLVHRTMTDNVHIIPGQIDRINKMIDDCDGVYLLDTVSNFGPFEPHLKKKSIRRFPLEKMAFTSEEELTGQTSLDLPDTDFIIPEDVNIDKTFIRYAGETQEQYFNRIMKGPFN